MTPEAQTAGPTIKDIPIVVTDTGMIFEVIDDEYGIGLDVRQRTDASDVDFMAAREALCIAEAAWWDLH